jgi:hypothetical protein
MSAAERFLASLRRAGRPMLLCRRIGTTSTFTDASIYGRSHGYKPNELVGLVQQGDRRIRISQLEIAAANWPGPPKKGDILDSGTIQGAEALYDGEALVGFVCWVRG